MTHATDSHVQRKIKQKRTDMRVKVFLLIECVYSTVFLLSFFSFSHKEVKSICCVRCSITFVIFFPPTNFLVVIVNRFLYCHDDINHISWNFLSVCSFSFLFFSFFKWNESRIKWEKVCNWGTGNSIALRLWLRDWFHLMHSYLNLF